MLEIEAQKHRCLHLKTATERDCHQLWQWANDPIVRQVSFSPDPIAWDQHCQWFAKKIQDSGCHIYIAFDMNEQPIGQIRFDTDALGQAEIDVSIDSEKRGLGYGAQLIALGVAKIFASTEITSVYALIKPENQPSIKAFEAAGFIKATAAVENSPALKYLRSRKNY